MGEGDGVMAPLSKILFAKTRSFLPCRAASSVSFRTCWQIKEGSPMNLLSIIVAILLICFNKATERLTRLFQIWERN